MSIKSSLARAVSYFTAVGGGVLTEAERTIVKVEAAFDKDVASIISQIPKDVAMPETNATPVDKVVAAIQIALALSAIDPTLTTAAVQAGTVAALSALYPVVAA